MRDVRKGALWAVGLAASATLIGACAGGGQGALSQPPGTTATSTTSGGEQAASSTTESSSADSGVPTVTINGWTGREPAAIYFSGDAGDIATGLTWTTWNQTEAVGHGTRNELGCVPDCAQGTSTAYPVTITMTRPLGGRFTSIVEQTADSKGTTNTFTAPDLGQGACTNSSESSCVFSAHQS